MQPTKYGWPLNRGSFDSEVLTNFVLILRTVANDSSVNVYLQQCMVTKSSFEDPGTEKKNAIWNINMQPSWKG